MNQAERIRSINDIGWDGVDASPTLKFENKDLQQELDMLFKRTFTSESGIKVLQHLESITLEQPSWVPGADSSYGFSREGQNSLVREIKQRMKRADERTG
ncbi:MAG: hypothetical protein Unbinned4509contig1000_27 [Prokaryotic dsDNA virus sp.]|nr:MAG: hypothetical protein Unbinned4509contig1000_27 [Prokaryotic dsDNA virus sp.]|tara:strand:- start:23504 stop:23803 length:300 start_codon:yes stop_codon:yes gene_type:complete